MKALQPKGSRKPIKLPDGQKEYLVIYATEYDDSYILEAITLEDVKVVKESVVGKTEQQIEEALIGNAVDDAAGIKLRSGILKIRKLDRSIGDNLKILYAYRCQICGQLIGEEFGSHIAEAHHIDYFIKSLNNDASNQIVVCPNHHRIIHDADPCFDRRNLRYIYPNGKEQRIVLNCHL